MNSTLLKICLGISILLVEVQANDQLPDNDLNRISKLEEMEDEKHFLQPQAQTQTQSHHSVDDFRKERDKSTTAVKSLLHLRHEQHHLRHQHSTAWEEMQHQHQQEQQRLHLQQQQQQQEQEQQKQQQLVGVVRHHQHKSQSGGIRHGQTLPDVDDIDYSNSYSYTYSYTTSSPPIRDPNYRKKNNLDGEEATFTPWQWQQLEATHRWQKQQHQKEMQSLRLRNRHTEGFNEAKFLVNDVRAGPKTLEEDNFNGRHDGENIYPGVLTKKKLDELGTPEAIVKAQRQRARQQKMEHALATKHFDQVMKEATCRIPQRRCKRLDHDISKNYSPQCAFLHRCSDDSGCCHSPTQICAPKSTRNVDLYFYVSSNKQPKPVVEKRTFANHTECHCIDRARYEEKEQMLTKEHATILNCNCPSHFEKILQDDGQCRCDCSSGNAVCISFKEGIEHFAMKDRKCIVYGLCKPPTCAFGNYLMKHGQCPKQPIYSVMS